MKQLIQIVISFFMLCTITNFIEAQDNSQDLSYCRKILIVYYSRADENYVSGKLQNLEEGNTSVIAHKIQNVTGADLFEIKTVKSYPITYCETTNIAKEELHNNARPEIAGQLPNVSKYDVIIVGYPIWWGTMPTVVMNFLEKCNFSGKKVIAFCTHEGSGLSDSISDLQKLCTGAHFGTNLAIIGEDVHSEKTESQIQDWLRKNNL